MTEKKHYEAPEMKVHQMQRANVIATSGPQTQSLEQYETGDTSGWY